MITGISGSGSSGLIDTGTGSDTLIATGNNNTNIKSGDGNDIVIDYVLSFTKYFVFTMVFMIIVIKLLPRYLEKIASYVNVSSFGTGIISLLIVPIILVLLLFLKITSIVSLTILMVFILLLLISLAVSNVAVGKLIDDKHGKRKLPIWTALITLFTWLVFQIPVAGGIIAFIWIMLGLGISIRYIFSRKK